MKVKRKTGAESSAPPEELASSSLVWWRAAAPFALRQSVFLLLGVLPCTYAATSTAWQISGFSDFTKGRLSGLSVSTDGILQLGPATKFTAALNEPAAWSVAPAPDGGVYVASGHNGKIFRVGSDGKTSVVWTAPQPEVFALCAGPGNVIYAGTSPNGGLFRIENGKAREVWHSPAKYIWALAPALDGVIYAATGEQGVVYRIQQNGAVQTYYETGQANVTSLTLGPNGHVYAGTDPNGLLYEIAAAGKATVLFDSSLPEIRAIAVAADGSVYAAAMGGAVSTRGAGSTTATPAATAVPVTAATPTVITVTESADQSVAAPPSQSQTPSSTSSATSAASQQQAGVVEVSGVDKSAIYKIAPDHGIETLRTSKEENVYDISLDGSALLFATDLRGRLYRLADHKTTLLTELADGETTRLLQSNGVVYAIMSNPARVFALAPAGSASGVYESQVHDATSVARWGHLQWHGTGAGVTFQTRTGFSARPDGTWNPWTPIDPATQRIMSPGARFIQFRGQWETGSSAQINSVDIPYLPQNGPPVIHSITVTSILEQNPAKSGGSSNNTAASSNTPYSITVTDTGEAPAASTGSSANQTASHLQTTQTQISWQADDPDGDKLAYSVYFRAEDEKEWQLVRSRMFENTLLLDPDVFADGRYFFRVVASDAPANAPEFAHEAELVSTPVLIDNTPPAVTTGVPQRSGAALDIDVEAVDKASPLRLCEYSLDAGSWQPIEAIDGVTDSPRETFHLHLDKLRPGEHLLVFRVYDSVNNAGLAKVILR